MKIFFFVFAAALSLTACNKQIDEIRPLNKIDKEGEFSSVAGVKETTIGNYYLLNGSGLLSFSLPLHAFGETRGNNVTLRQFGPPIKETDAFFFQNNNAATLGYSSDLYRGAYQVIVSANATLEGIETLMSTQFGSLTAEEKNNLLYLKGENMFLRAFVYFTLTTAYGRPYYQNAGTSLAVPLKKTSDIKETPQRSTVKEMYDFILSELQEAAQLMKAPVAKSNSFASTGAAWALLSRAYLYKGGTIASPDAESNQKSIDYADSLISHTNGKYSLIYDNAYINMFADDQAGVLGRSIFKDNREIIFAYDHAVGGTGIAGLYHYDMMYNVGGTFIPSNDFMELLQREDYRAGFFKVNASNNYKETTKWLVLNQYISARAPNIFFRMGEVYLNRAEAYAKLGNFALAKADLREIHTRAGLPAAEIDNLADADVIGSVLKERRIELAFEGHNGFDYFRNGLPMKRAAEDYNGQEFIIEPDDPKVVFTIPNI